MLSLLVYMAVIGTVAVAVPVDLSNPEVKQLGLLLGAIGIWRYGWQAVHFSRYLIYKYRRFPALRREADRVSANSDAPHVYFVVTSFRISPEISIRVFQSVMDEAANCANATVVASVVEPSDERLVKSIYRGRQPRGFRLLIIRIRGTGKRSAIAYALRAVAADMPDPNALVALVDGDTVLAPNTVADCAPFFTLNPRLGALTTDEIPIIQGSRIVRDWYRLRFAQRHVHMSSMALSKRVLTLTGRMSIYRADIATNTSFIRAVEFDSLTHWRLGKFQFLTGDDKSTWFWVLRNRHEMLYVPDVVALTMERLPTPSFVDSSMKLMFRWFGNMLRTSGRAIALGPNNIGWFPWWSLVDQRVSMWTTLIAPTIVLASTLAYGTAQFLYVYVLWVGITRGYLSILIYTVRRQVSGTYPFLIYYNQIVGSLVKTWVLFHLDRQTWTRQTTNVGHGRRWSSMLVYTSVFSVFLAVVVFGLADLTPPTFDFVRYLLGG